MEDEREPRDKEPGAKEPRYMTGVGFLVILFCTVIVGTFSEPLVRMIWPHTTRRTGWVGPLFAISTFAYLFSAERTKRIRQLLADKL
ncbi:MAG TPA: hypothetical protein VGF76_07595 [Polyangiaceae bacterium]